MAGNSFSKKQLENLCRRSFLSASGLGVLGLTYQQCLSAAEVTGKKARAKNILVIYEQGGLSHMDTWDPKPDAISEYRSPYKPISTNVPGIQFTELLSKTAKLANKLTVIRSMHHTRGGADAHPNGTQYALSGSHPANAALTMPDIGSIVSLLQGSNCKYLPPYIMVPGNHEQAAETRHAFLPASAKVFKTGGRDLSDPSWKIESLLPRQENQGDRFLTRKQLTDVLASAGKSESAGIDRFLTQAFDMISSPKVADAFNIQKESTKTREAYGAGHRGACYLVGRKLIEAGVRFVTVDTRWPLTKETPRGGNLNWDHHDHIYASTTCELPGATGAGAGRYGIGHWVMMGSTDQAFAALITDMEERGLLADTLVCFVSEFGRTPKINKAKGRDHWTHAYSMVMAGAGVPGGQVIGKSDREGGYVVESPFTPEDYATTIYEKLGIDRTQPIYTSSNRPVFFGHAGEPIRGVF
ncbi:MAG: DUF1501 domain-containing protein [Planctomycetia bacterium]